MIRENTQTVVICMAFILSLGLACSSEESSTTTDAGMDVAPDSAPTSDTDTEVIDEADATNASDAPSQPDIEEGPDATGPICSVEATDITGCNSGHSELDAGEVLTLLPEGLERAGCTAFGDHSTFESVEETTWTVRGCQGETHRFHLPLLDCRGQSYPAYLSIEPVTNQCGLDEYASVEFSPAPSSSTDLSCEELQRTHYCYVEDPHSEGGGADWTLFTNEANSTDNIPWTIELEVEIDWGAEFEYEIAVHVPPLEN